MLCRTHYSNNCSKETEVPLNGPSVPLNGPVSYNYRCFRIAAKTSKKLFETFLTKRDYDQFFAVAMLLKIKKML